MRICVDYFEHLPISVDRFRFVSHLYFCFIKIKWQMTYYFKNKTAYIERYKALQLKFTTIPYAFSFLHYIGIQTFLQCNNKNRAVYFFSTVDRTGTSLSWQKFLLSTLKMSTQPSTEIIYQYMVTYVVTYVLYTKMAYERFYSPIANFLHCITTLLYQKTY